MPELPSAIAPSYHPSPRAPSLELPAGACDAHCHVFGPVSRFPFDRNSPFRPADAPKEKLFVLHAMLGIERCVIVQSTCHGFDNSVVADAVAAKGGSYCGIALVPVSISEVDNPQRLYGFPVGTSAGIISHRPHVPASL